MVIMAPPRRRNQPDNKLAFTSKKLSLLFKTHLIMCVKMSDFTIVAV